VPELCLRACARACRAAGAWHVLRNLVLVALAFTLCGGTAFAAPFEFHYTEVVAVEGHYVLNAAISGEAPARLEELVQAGVSVPFNVEFVLRRPRWWWFDEVIVERVMELKLSYHALTRQYRLGSDGLYRSFTSFEQAFAALRSVRNWVVVDRGVLQDGESYNAALRIRLDMSQLPKPFQVAAIGSRDLDLTSAWSRWTFMAGAR